MQRGQGCHNVRRLHNWKTLQHMWELSRTSGLGAGFFDSGLGSSAIVTGTSSPLAELLLNRQKHVPDVFG